MTNYSTTREKRVSSIKRTSSDRDIGRALLHAFTYPEYSSDEFVLNELESEPETDLGWLVENKHGWQILCYPLLTLDIDFKPNSDGSKSPVDIFQDKKEFERYLLVVLHNIGLAWRLYETAGGFRVILNDVESKADSKLVKDLCEVTWTDPLYTTLSKVQGNYRARVNVKMERVNDYTRKPKALRFIEGRGDFTEPDAVALLNLHDELAQPVDNKDWDDAKYYLA